MIRKGNRTVFWGYMGVALQILTAMGFNFDSQALTGDWAAVPYILSGLALGVGALVHKSRRAANSSTT